MADALIAESDKLPPPHPNRDRLRRKAKALRDKCSPREKGVYRRMKQAKARYEEERRAHLAEHFAQAEQQVERKPPPMVWDDDRRQWRQGIQWIGKDDPDGMLRMRHFVNHITPRKKNGHRLAK